MYIIAGKKAPESVRNTKLVELRERVEATRDQLDVRKYREYVRPVSIQMALALEIEHTIHALNVQSAVDEMTNEMFRRNAEILKLGAIDALGYGNRRCWSLETDKIMEIYLAEIGDECMKKKLKVAFNAPVVLGFVGVCLVVTVLGVISGGRITYLAFMTYHSALLSPMTYLRFFTHVFGHAGWEHYFGNMLYILLLGPLLEEKYGSATIIETIGITALVTGLVNYIVFPNVALCGASGVVFSFILLASFTSFREGEIPLTFILIAVFFIGQQIVQGITVSDNISNMAHICGGIVGSVIGYSLNKNVKKPKKLV